jgi:archaellum component FlaF (FlaF/FlaG flagellin family)
MRRAAFSTILAHALLFIAAAVATYLFVSSLYKSLYDIQGAMQQREQLMSDRLKTIFTIDSCSYNNTTNQISIYLTNIGYVALDPTKLKVFVNGILVNNTTTMFAYQINPNDAWERYETIKIVFNYTTGTIDVKVVASNGAYTDSILYITNTSCTIQ